MVTSLVKETWTSKEDLEIGSLRYLTVRLLHELMNMPAESEPDTYFTRSQIAIVKEAEALILSNLTRRITAKELAERFGVSESSFKFYVKGIGDSYLNETIRKDLIREARRCGITIGMRKTSVEQLTNAVGISKGSFYKFFDSKELLFFTVLEDIHTECFAAAQRSLQENAAFAPAARAAEAILAACRWLAETKAFVFIEQDADFLLHRLPENVKTAHYHDDETHIRALLEAGGLQPKGGMALAAATVRGLILTVSHQEQIGALYPQVLETLVRGACRELFA